MRFFLVSVLLLNMVGTSRADDLADLPELACALASTSLERQQIGCLNDIPSKEAVRFEQPGELAND